MNKFFYPGTEKIDKPGLERHHQLIESSTSQTALQSQKKVRESLPNNWIYNNNKANEVWNELEQFEANEKAYFKSDEPNPLAKIDESAKKIRNTITNFEVQDQEFLMEYMNLLDDDSFVDSLDQSSILFEARYRLQQMIEEHIDFGERQATLLSNLTTWFTDIKNKEQDDMFSFSSLKVSNNNTEDKLGELRRLIDDYKNTSNGQIERAENLHEDMVQNLNERVNDCQKIISQKDLELIQLNQNLQQTNSKRKGRVFNVRDSVHYDAELAFSQRRVMELQEQLNTIKTSLNEYTKIKKSDSLREIMIMANLDNKTENSENSSLKSERNSVAFTSLNVNDMNFSKLKDNADGLISVEREIEFDSKICVLANQIRNLKDDNRILQDQIMQTRQNEIVSEKRIQSIERQKKTTESALQTLNKKMANMKDSYERKIQELQGDLSSGISLNKESENILEMKKNYESRIDKMGEDYRKQIKIMQDSMDKKYQKQINDVFKTCKNGDTSAALEQVTLHFQQQVLELERHFDKELKNEKRKNAEKLVDLTKHYETLIKKKDKEIERIRNSVESEIQSRILDVKIEFDEKFNSKSFEDHENSVNEYNEIRRKMQGSIDLLQSKLLKMTRERDTLKSLVEANDLAVDLMDELNSNDYINKNENENGEEEEDYGLNNEQKEENFLNDSLFSLKEKEIEQKVSEKFSLILKAQKENLQDYHQYELDNAKKFLKFQFQQLVNEFREKVVEKAGEINDKLLNENTTDGYQKELENLLIETVKLASFDSDYELDELFRNPTIPLSELDCKVENYRNQIIELTSENELWKTTFKHFKSHEGGSDKDNSDGSIIDSMKAVIEKQSKRMAEIDKENRTLCDKLRKLSSSKMDLLNSMKDFGPIEICKVFEFHLYDNNLNDENYKFKNSPSNGQIEETSSTPIIIQKQTENNTNSTNNINYNNNNNTSNDDVPNGKVCCFHCHSCYSPQNVAKKCVNCQISKCPKCSHFCLMPQTEEVSIVDIESLQNKAKNNKNNEDSSNFVSGDLSLPTKPNLESNSTFNHQETLNDSTPNQNPQQQQTPNQQPQPQHLQVQQKQELPHQFELELQKQKNEQMKEELDKANKRNEQMKSKLSLYEKNFGDLEKQYIKKINKISDDLSTLQKNFIEDSITIVQSVKQLSDDQQENLEKKTSTSTKIAQVLKNIDFPCASSTETLCKEFIEFTEEKLTNDSSIDDINESLEQAEYVLLSLTTDPQVHKKIHKNNQNNDNNESIQPNGSFSIADNSILNCKLNVCKMNIEILKEHNDFIAEIVKEILDQMKKMSLKIKQIGKSSIRMAQNMKDELNTVSHDLNLIIEQRTKAMNDARQEILNQKSAYDSLQEKFRTSIAAFEKLQISSSTNQDEVNLLKKKEYDQVHTIESLTDKLLQSQEINRNNEKEIEQLKLRIMELESDQLLLSARLDTQQNNENENDKIRRFNSEEFQFEDNNNNNEGEENKNDNDTSTEKVSSSQYAINFPSPLPSIPTIESDQQASFDFVPSFVVFSTDENIENNNSSRKKGFSLLPRRLALQQSKPIFQDVSHNSPLNSPNVEPQQNSSENQNKSDKKHEKIRVKYIQTGYQSTAIAGVSNARVIVPISRPKTSSLNRTQPNPTNSNSSNQSMPSNTQQSEDSKSESSNSQMPRVLSFENLVPLMEDDVITGTLIGYVTRYVRELPPEKSLENQAKIREEKKKILRTSSVLISEVPPEKLRFDNANNNNNDINNSGSVGQMAAKSMISFGAKYPLNSDHIQIQNQSSVGSTNCNLKSQKNIERFPRTKEDWLDKCEKKIKSLEGQLRDSSNLLQQERDKSHRALQAAFKESIELKQSQRQQKKMTLLHDATKKRLEQALELVTKSDNEIARLKKLLNEVSSIARSIEDKEINETDDHHPFPTKKKVHARPNKLSILSSFEDESNRLLSVFRGVCSGITNMAQKEIESIRKWAPKKDRYINNEKVKLMSALEAMRFITSPDSFNDSDKEKKKSLRSAVRVNSFDKKLKLKNQEKQKKRPVSRPVVQKNDQPVSFEKATVTANMHNQKVPKSLKKGVIGRPATSHSNV